MLSSVSPSPPPPPLPPLASPPPLTAPPSGSLTLTSSLSPPPGSPSLRHNRRLFLQRAVDHRVSARQQCGHWLCLAGAPRPSSHVRAGQTGGEGSVCVAGSSVVCQTARGGGGGSGRVSVT
eukprot:933678-Rhodomonas_salina.1